jgi:hypothetical protein
MNAQRHGLALLLVLPLSSSPAHSVALNTTGTPAAAAGTFPLDVSLRSVPALPKVHHSSYFDFLSVGTDSSNPLLVEFARITHSFPVDLNIDASPIFNATTIGEAVHICRLRAERRQLLPGLELLALVSRLVRRQLAHAVRRTGGTRAAVLPNQAGERKSVGGGCQ